MTVARDRLKANFRGLDKHRRYTEASLCLDRHQEVLDVGGGTGDFLDFSECKGVVAEVSPSRSLFAGVRTSHRIVRFDGVRIPFKDSSFDVVVCLDTLEHVPRNTRPKLVSEMVRVSRDKVIVTFPERQYFLPILTAIAHVYDLLGISSVMRRSLEEHSRNGLPKRDEIIAAVEGENVEVVERGFFGPGSTVLWIAQLCLPFLATTPFNNAFARLSSGRGERETSERLMTLAKT